MGTPHVPSMHLAPRLHDPPPLPLEELSAKFLSFLALLLESLQAVLGRISAPHPLYHLRAGIFL